MTNMAISLANTAALLWGLFIALGLMLKLLLIELGLKQAFSRLSVLCFLMLMTFPSVISIVVHHSMLSPFLVKLGSLIRWAYPLLAGAKQ